MPTIEELLSTYDETESLVEAERALNAIAEQAIPEELALGDLYDQLAEVAVEVRIGVTEPGCMMGASFAIKARERLEALRGVVDVCVELDHEGDWEPADIDPAYAKRLSAIRTAKRDARGGRSG
jgi:metal-sulfur cluster biosynthetic enzyme